MMTYAEYVRNITFKFLPPHKPRPHGFRGLSRLLTKFGVHLEMNNTVLPEDDLAMKQRLRQVCAIPRMSTFAIGAMINRGVGAMPAGQAFVNVGVWNGFTYLSGCAGNELKKCIAVDSYPFPHSPKEAFQQRFEQFRSDNHRFYEMDYRDYFKKIHHDPIGFYIYDGDHKYEHQLEGLRIAEPHFADGCIILVDDTSWDQPRRGTMDFIAESDHQYDMLLDARACADAHPTYWNGVMIFQKVG